MSIDKLKSVSEEIVNRLSVVRGKGEEATKQALVLPMLNALGFDIWNPTEVCPEYEADFALKKQGQKEKVDLAILINDIPRVYIEVKACDISLDGHEGQLMRYFNSTVSVSLAILTNGVEYRFYTDTKAENMMDQSPFHIAKLDAVEQGLEVLARFHKSVFSPGAIRDFATKINYTTNISSFLRKHLDLGDSSPSESFVRWVLTEEGSYAGRVRSKIIEQFHPIIKESLQIVLRDIVRRSVAALDKEVSSPSQQSANKEQAVDDLTIFAPMSERKALRQTITTEDELALFAEVKAYFESSKYAKEKIFDSDSNQFVQTEIAYADNPIYFSIYINNPSFWIIRAAVESKNPWIGFNVNPEEGDALIPQGCTKFQPYAHSKFRMSFDKKQMAKPFFNLISLAIQRVIEEASKEK